MATTNTRVSLQSRNAFVQNSQPKGHKANYHNLGDYYAGSNVPLSQLPTNIIVQNTQNGQQPQQISIQMTGRQMSGARYQVGAN